LPAKTFDAYLASLPAEQRATLQRLREVVHAAAPEAEEYIGYGLAAFRLNGRPLVALGASAKHCSFHPMNGTTIAAMKDDLAGYETSKGTIRFAVRKPLPAALVRKIVKTRVAENQAAATPRANERARSLRTGPFLLLGPKPTAARLFRGLLALPETNRCAIISWPSCLARNQPLRGYFGP